MKSLLSIFCFLFLLSSIAQTRNYKSTVITDPSISRRCEVLLKKRNQKVEVRQKLTSLIVRNKKASKLAPSNKKKAKRLLAQNLIRLENEKRLVVLKIQKQEEDIIRRGCPGIKL